MLLSTVAQAIGATFSGKDLPFLGVSIDSRTVQPGQLFVVIQGERFDGHQFIEQALANGAAAVLISQKTYIEKLPASITYVLVEDTTQALGQLATYWRRQFSIPIVGITGSCGKTSTKELTRAVLSVAGETLATTGTLNNHWGVPLTLLQLNDSYDYAVIEMGANHLGEIAYLTNISQPTIALITNVAPVHIEGFGSIEGIAQEKGEIYSTLKAGDCAILNRDDAFYEDWRASLPEGVRIVTFGIRECADVMAQEVSLENGHAHFKLSYQNKEVAVALRLLGQYQVQNALAAAAVGLVLNLSLSQIVTGLQVCMGANGRMQKQIGKKGVRLIDDSYNANPTAVKAAIDFLAHAPGDTLLILGEMGELGDRADDYHDEMGHFAKQKGIRAFWAVGARYAGAMKAFGEGGRLFSDKPSLIEALETKIHSDLTILVKGSRSAKMETIVQALTLETHAQC